ncbi:response regulator transcription factor [Kineococcus indalonis]|uniref:response regulator transcription factor n=1 Tax=Kineococcus indalonis TaxID=2696566 RepID=UPI0014133CA7|nr:response regulator transcription factor [Kineococcus indalonis]NAZ84794.1 hypothetical protein [Kineococcus indalonis]
MSTSARPGPLVVLSGVPEVYGHGLAHALSAAGAHRVVRTDGEDLLELLTEHPAPAVLVVPEAAAEEVRSALRGSPVGERVALVHLAPGAGRDGFVGAVRAGALGVLDPDAELETAVEVVLSAAAGRVLVPRTLVESLAEPVGSAGAPQLAEHEREWLRMLGQGGTVAAIARSASYSEREMYRLLAKLYRRLGAETRTQALLRAADWGLLDEGGNGP